MDILHNLLTLESLVFADWILFDRGSEQDHMLSGKLVDVSTASKLKSLSLKFGTHGEKDIMEKCNLLLQFTLKACPQLEEIKLKGFVSAAGTLKLDFRRHAHLKYVEIDLKGCRYYTFYHPPGKKWKNLGEQIFQSNINKFDKQSSVPYCINFA